jgi:hypothetical protein
MKRLHRYYTKIIEGKQNLIFKIGADNNKESGSSSALTDDIYTLLSVFNMSINKVGENLHDHEEYLLHSGSNVIGAVILKADHLIMRFNKLLKINELHHITDTLVKLGIVCIDINPKAHQFYSNNGGDEILHDVNYPEEIVNYLAAQETQIEERLKTKKYTALFEIACGDAQNLEIARKHQVHYYGIDFVDDCIRRAKTKINELGLQKTAQVKCMSALDLNTATTPIQSNEKVLCILPFNCIGNIGNVIALIDSLDKLGYDVMISTYKLNGIANAARAKYYKNCGYQNLQREENEVAEIFTSDEGLHSVSYQIEYMKDIFSRTNYQLTVSNITDIGIMYGLEQKSKLKLGLFMPQPQPREQIPLPISSPRLALA